MGTVTYRCFTCSELIEDSIVVFTGEGKDTHTYHPECLPALPEPEE